MQTIPEYILVEMNSDLQDRCHANQGKTHWLCDRCKWAKFCKYRSTDRGLQTCSYILFKGEPRGCNISDCDKYEPRRKK